VPTAVAGWKPKSRTSSGVINDPPPPAHGDYGMNSWVFHRQVAEGRLNSRLGLTSFMADRNARAM